jgi:hypothetical protein
MGIRFIDMPIIFGRKNCQITSHVWDSERRVADISYRDELGQEFATTALSMNARDVRRAVLDAIIADYNRP